MLLNVVYKNHTIKRMYVCMVHIYIYRNINIFDTFSLLFFFYFSFVRSSGGMYDLVKKKKKKIAEGDPKVLKAKKVHGRGNLVPKVQNKEEKH